MMTLLHPMWVVGFVDGEGCFRASMIKNVKLRFGMQIQMEFVVVQHERDIDLLYKLQTFFKCGQVSKTKGSKDSTDQSARFRVRKLLDLQTMVIPFFEQNHLQTKKQVEFFRSRELCFLLHQKIHLQEEGFHRCLHLAKTLPFEKMNS